MPPVPLLIGGTNGGTLGAFSGVQWAAAIRNGQTWEFVSEPPPATVTVMGGYLLNSAGTSFGLHDAGDGPSSAFAPMYWDGVSNLVTFLWRDTVGSTVALRNFNLDTMLWEPDFAVTADLALDDPVALWKRSDGSWIGLFLQTGGDILVYVTSIFTGGVWSSPVDITVNAGGLGFESYDNATSIITPDDVLLTIFHASDGNEFFLQATNQDGTLGVFQQFPGQSGSPQDLNATVTASTLAIVGDSLLWGITRNFDGGAGVGIYQAPAVYVGTPLSNPVWTESGSIDPNSFVLVGGDPIPQPQSPTTYGNLFYNNGTLYSVYIRNVYTDLSFPVLEGQIMISQTKDPTFLTGWTSASFYDPNANPTLFPPGDTAFGFTPLLAFDPTGDIVGVSVDYTDTTAAGPEQRYWFGAAIPPTPVAPAVSGFAAGATTGARFKPCTRQGQEYLSMQFAEKTRALREKRKAWPFPHLFPTDRDIPVNLVSDAVLGTSSDLALLTYVVPSGFRFWMDAVLFDGPAPFSPGDAIFSLRKNQNPVTSTQSQDVQGFQSIPIPLGSVENGTVWPLRMPYSFEPLTTLLIAVHNVNFNDGDLFTGGLFGFLVPLQRGNQD